VKNRIELVIPVVVGLGIYILIDKLFPQTISSKKEINFQNDKLDSNIERTLLIRKKILKILGSRAFKIALIAMFSTAGLQSFHNEITELVKDPFTELMCHKEADGKLKLVCDIVEKNKISLDPLSKNQIILNPNFSNTDKINLLKIKLDYILNGDIPGRKRFVIISLLAILISVSLTGVGGLVIFLEALYQLFREGKISRSVYEYFKAMILRQIDSLDTWE
jgi:hypothetical protein